MKAKALYLPWARNPPLDLEKKAGEGRSAFGGMKTAEKRKAFKKMTVEAVSMTKGHYI